MATRDGALNALRPSLRASLPTATIEALRGATTSLYRWLRADPEDSVRMQASVAAPRPATRSGADLRVSLGIWASMIRRRRAAVVVRRSLIAGLCVAIVVEAVLVALGDQRLGVWLLAPPVLAVLAGAIASRSPLRPELAAQMLDRFRDLHDLLVTATQILASKQPASGLDALVLDEARVAAGESFATVRLTASPPRREWRLLSFAVAALAAIALVSVHSGRSAIKRHERAGAAPSAAAGHRRSAPSSVKATSGGARVVGQPAPPRLSRPPLAVSTEGAGRSSSSGFSPYGHGGKELSAKQLAREGIATPPAGGRSLGTVAVGEHGGSPGQGASTPASAKPGAGGGAGKPAGGAQATTSAPGRGASSPGGRGTQAQGGGTPQRTPAGLGTRQANASSGGASTGSSPPGGNGAGSGRGSAGLGAGLVPALGTGPLGLPLQAGFAPGGARRSQGGEGVSQTPNGGGSGGRSAHANSGGEGSVGSQLSVIPPSVNSTPELDQGVLSGYFGSSNQLIPRNW